MSPSDQYLKNLRAQFTANRISINDYQIHTNIIRANSEIFNIFLETLSRKLRSGSISQTEYTEFIDRWIQFHIRKEQKQHDVKFDDFGDSDDDYEPSKYVVKQTPDQTAVQLYNELKYNYEQTTNVLIYELNAKKIESNEYNSRLEQINIMCDAKSAEFLSKMTKSQRSKLFPINKIPIYMPGNIGIINYGMTCYLGTCLQILFHIPTIVNIFNTADSISMNVDKRETLSFIKLVNLYKKYNTTICPLQIPADTMSTFASLSAMQGNEIGQNRQCDFMETLLFMIDIIHEATAQPAKFTFNPTTTDPTSIEHKCHEMLKNNYERQFSKIIQNVACIEVTQIKSLENPVNILSERPEIILQLHLSISRPTLAECLDNYTSQEQMIGENAYFNDATNAKEDVTKELKFYSLPKIFIIALNRFGNDQRKITSKIAFPSTGLDMSPYVIGPNPQSYVYDLCAMANHYGSHQSGHYTSCVKCNTTDGKWRFFNDTNVSVFDTMPRDMLESSDVYTLIYIKRS